MDYKHKQRHIAPSKEMGDTDLISLPQETARMLYRTIENTDLSTPLDDVIVTDWWDSVLNMDTCSLSTSFHITMDSENVTFLLRPKTGLNWFEAVRAIVRVRNRLHRKMSPVLCSEHIKTIRMWNTLEATRGTQPEWEIPHRRVSQQRHWEEFSQAAGYRETFVGAQCGSRYFHQSEQNLHYLLCLLHKCTTPKIGLRYWRIGPIQHRHQLSIVENDIDVCIFGTYGHCIGVIVDHRYREVLCIGSDERSNLLHSGDCGPICTGSHECTEECHTSFHDQVCKTYNWGWCDLQRDGECNCQTWPLVLIYAVVFENWKPLELHDFFECFVSGSSDITYQFGRFLQSLVTLCGAQKRVLHASSSVSLLDFVNSDGQEDAVAHPEIIGYNPKKSTTKEEI